MDYAFKIISPTDDNGKMTRLTNLRNSIFLAGPCPRVDYSDDWRFEAFDLLGKIGFSGNVITPTNSNYNKMTTDFGLSKSEALTQQTEWERTAMHCASAIVFWIPRSEKNPARTTNIEFGEWYKKNNVFVGWPDGAVHNEYIELKLNEQNKKRFSSLKDALKAAVSALNRPGTMFFTSDTHFSQKRTLELSRRPFIDVKEMDLTLISNWNKTVTMNDVVYHAGDFIDPDKASKLKPLLDNLNFKELHWICGNYDRYILSKIEHLALNYDRSIYIHSTAAVVHVDSVPVGIVHEPIDPGDEYMSRKDFFNAMVEEDPKIFLYGHIHGRSFAKKNGIDLASDYHRYTPISLDDVRWYINAMNYWDENVYTDVVR